MTLSIAQSRKNWLTRSLSEIKIFAPSRLTISLGGMDYDILESVSQGLYGAYDKENRRIQEISDELQGLCRLHEEKPRTGKADGSRFEIEQRAAEEYAKSKGMGMSMVICM